MKPQPSFQEILLKKLTFTLVLLAAVVLCKLPFLNPVLQASQKTTPGNPTSSRTALNPAKQSLRKTSRSAATRKKLASRSKKPRRKVIRGQRTIESARVVEIQNALAAAGYYKEAPSGQWDESTSKAMSAYQQDNGFRTTGRPDALSLKKLGL